METQTVGESWFGHCREKITNIRYANDLMLYARSLQDLRDMTDMTEFLITELGTMGLQLNASKTKTFTTFSGSKPMHMEFVGSSMQILSGRSKHKYLGKTLVGDLRHRAEVELGWVRHWTKVHKHRHVLTNRHVAWNCGSIVSIQFCFQQFYLVWLRCHSPSLNCNDWTLPNGRCSEQL